MDSLRPRLAVSILLAASFLSGIANAAPRRSGASIPPGSAQRPDTFGIDDYTITSLSDLEFTPFNTSVTYDANGADFFRYVTSAGGGSFVTGAELPAGAVIDYVGLGSCDAAGLAFAVSVDELTAEGTFTPIVGVASTAHSGTTSCGVDYNVVAANYEIAYNSQRTIQIQVVQAPTAPTDGSARFSGVEIWWHRIVSPAPAAATFNDVPTGHPFFQYIEALAASGITGGCGGGNYCPDAPLTRGQMAVFLAKALGLHFPGNLPI